MNKEKVLDYVMNSPGNSNRAVLSGMLDESDGGGGDFSIVTMTLETDTSIAAPFIQTSLTNPSFDYIESGGETLKSAGAYNIVLYKGKAIVFISGEDIQITGEIESIDEYTYIVTGNCNITTIK